MYEKVKKKEPLPLKDGNAHRGQHLPRWVKW